MEIKTKVTLDPVKYTPATTLNYSGHVGQEHGQAFSHVANITSQKQCMKIHKSNWNEAVENVEEHFSLCPGFLTQDRSFLQQAPLH